jgi:hypothetical protein
MKFGIYACLCCGFAAAFAQTPQPSGVSSEWDVRKLLESLDLQTQHLKPIIEQVQPQKWLADGAPDTYVAQWKTAQDQLRYLLSSSETLAKQPDRLTLALDTFFRMQAMEITFGSVIEGIRKYQNPALADLVHAFVAENSNNRDMLRQYIQDLAAQKEQEFRVADREAQRCREASIQQPASKERKPAHK